MLYFYVFFKILIKLEKKKNSRLVHSLDKTSLSVLALQEELSSSQTCTCNGSVYISSTTQICQQASGFKSNFYLETLAVLVLNLVWRNKIYWVALKMLCHKFSCLLYCRINLYLPKLRCTNKVKAAVCALPVDCPTGSCSL